MQSPSPPQRRPEAPCSPIPRRGRGTGGGRGRKPRPPDRQALAIEPMTPGARALKGDRLRAPLRPGGGAAVGHRRGKQLLCFSMLRASTTRPPAERRATEKAPRGWHGQRPGGWAGPVRRNHARSRPPLAALVLALTGHDSLQAHGASAPRRIRRAFSRWREQAAAARRPEATGCGRSGGKKGRACAAFKGGYL